MGHRGVTQSKTNCTSKSWLHTKENNAHWKILVKKLVWSKVLPLTVQIAHSYFRIMGWHLGWPTNLGCVCLCCVLAMWLLLAKLSMSNFLFCVIRGWCDSPIVQLPPSQRIRSSTVSWPTAEAECCWGSPKSQHHLLIPILDGVAAASEACGTLSWGSETPEEGILWEDEEQWEGLSRSISP